MIQFHFGILFLVIGALNTGQSQPLKKLQAHKPYAKVNTTVTKTTILNLYAWLAL